MHHLLIAASASAGMLGLCSACAPSPMAASIAPRVGLAVSAQASESRGLRSAGAGSGRRWSRSVRITLGFSARPPDPFQMRRMQLPLRGERFDAQVGCVEPSLCAWERRARDAAWEALEGELR